MNNFSRIFNESRIKAKSWNFKKITILTLMGIGAICIILVGVLISQVVVATRDGERLDKQSKDYLDQVVPIISKNWDEDELRARASDEFMSVTNDEELKQMFDYAEDNLGQMKDYNGSHGESRILINNTKKEITATYLSQAEFEEGTASVKVSLIKKGGQWSILEYKVNSDVFKPY